jgi:hypothetical protein
MWPSQGKYKDLIGSEWYNYHCEDEAHTSLMSASENVEI